jgi:hypothetical protein
MGLERIPASREQQREVGAMAVAEELDVLRDQTQPDAYRAPRQPAIDAHVLVFQHGGLRCVEQASAICAEHSETFRQGAG